jgi:hypothetical protein
MNRIVALAALLVALTGPAAAQGQFDPYPDPAAVAVCQVNIQTQNVVPENGAPRCFVISADVVEAITRWMLTQRAGLDEQGNTLYKWDSWWHLLVHQLSRRWVIPMLDEFPPTELVTAKDNATAAAAALDLTRANLIAALTYFKCSPASAPTGTNVTCRVVLTGAPTVPLTVAVSSNSANLTVPATITIAPDTTGIAFTAQATGEVTVNQTATVTVTLNGITKQSVVTVTPPTP